MNTAWIFDQVWLAGHADIVTSNNFQDFLLRSAPSAWQIQYGAYVAMVVVVDVLGVIGCGLIVLWTMWQRRRPG